MNAYRWNGEYWYEDEGLARRSLKWLAWFGGWEAHSPKRAWSLHRWTLRERMAPGLLTPISFLGHRITFYGWGWKVKARGGSLVSSKGSVYFSPDGTPTSATIWFKGTPGEVRSAAAKSAHLRKRVRPMTPANYKGRDREPNPHVSTTCPALAGLGPCRCDEAMNVLHRNLPRQPEQPDQSAEHPKGETCERCTHGLIDDGMSTIRDCEHCNGTGEKPGEESSMSEIDWDAPVSFILRYGDAAAAVQTLGGANNAPEESLRARESMRDQLAASQSAEHPKGETCGLCEGVGEVAKNFGAYGPGIPEIVTCPDCNGTGEKPGEHYIRDLPGGGFEEVPAEGADREEGSSDG